MFVFLVQATVLCAIYMHRSQDYKSFVISTLQLLFALVHDGAHLALDYVVVAGWPRILA